MNAIKQFEPGELLSGVVREDLLHQALFILETTPKWSQKIHWRPSLYSHYIDVMEMICHRLPTESQYKTPIEAERDTFLPTKYGEKLFPRKNKEAIDRAVAAIELLKSETNVRFKKKAQEAVREIKKVMETAKTKKSVEKLKPQTPMGKRAQQGALFDSPDGSGTKRIKGVAEVSVSLFADDDSSSEGDAVSSRTLAKAKILKDNEADETTFKTNDKPALFQFRMDICHIVALRMRNDEMLRGNFSGISRTYPRNKRMIQARMNLLIRKMRRAERA
jgi:hypothetical protein